MTALFHDIIFGPVHSRRLGLSLGVNLLPLSSKLCSFDCIYCECGWNAEHPGGRRFNSREDVRTQLEATLRRMVADSTPPDVITFAGNGEPTMHPDFEAGIGDTIPARIVSPALTTVHIPYKTSGMEAAKMLVERMETEGAVVKELKMGYEIVMRGSLRGNGR